MRCVALALVLGLRVTGDEVGLHRLLMIIIISERGRDLGRRQVGISLNDVRRAAAMRHVIGDEGEDPMAGAVEARDPARRFRVMWGAGVSSGIRVLLHVSFACDRPRVKPARHEARSVRRAGGGRASTAPRAAGAPHPRP
jgi:hypothetical protein